MAKKLLLSTGLILCVAIGSLCLLREALSSQHKVQKRQEKVESSKQKSVTELLGDLKRGDPKAIPALKEAFERSDDKFEKQTVAGVLLSFGVRDEQYLKYLIQFAKAAIESEIPFPLSYDSQGKGVKGKFSPEFLAWAIQNKVDPGIAAGIVISQLPHDVMSLAMASDPRAFDLLLQGLESQNHMIVIVAAQGLAKLQDKRAIAPTIRACKRVPAEVADLIAQYLPFFDDPEAQKAAEEFIQNKAVLDEVRKRAREIGPKGIFGF